MFLALIVFFASVLHSAKLPTVIPLISSDQVSQLSLDENGLNFLAQIQDPLYLGFFFIRMQLFLF